MNRRTFLSLSGVIPMLPFTALPPTLGPTILDLVDDGTLGVVPRLHPVQRLILKLTYGLELNDEDRAYLIRLEQEGRYTPGLSDSREAVIVMGRRSGKTILGQVIQAYETHQLLHTDSTFQTVLTVGSDRDQVGLSKSCFGSFLKNSPNRQYLEGVTKGSRQHYRFQTEDRVVKGRYSSPSNYDLRSVRGRRSQSTVLDEGACFLDVRKVVAPFSERLTMLTTSDGSQEFRMFYEASRGRALTLRIPTWEANPLLPRNYSYFSEQRNSRGSREFDLEFGAAV